MGRILNGSANGFSATFLSIYLWRNSLESVNNIRVFIHSCRMSAANQVVKWLSYGQWKELLFVSNYLFSSVNFENNLVSLFSFVQCLRLSRWRVAMTRCLTSETITYFSKHNPELCNLWTLNIKWLVVLSELSDHVFFLYQILCRNSIFGTRWRHVNFKCSTFPTFKIMV